MSNFRQENLHIDQICYVSSQIKKISDLKTAQDSWKQKASLPSPWLAPGEAAPCTHFQFSAFSCQSWMQESMCHIIFIGPCEACFMEGLGTKGSFLGEFGLLSL